MSDSKDLGVCCPIEGREVFSKTACGRKVSEQLVYRSMKDSQVYEKQRQRHRVLGGDRSAPGYITKPVRCRQRASVSGSIAVTCQEKPLAFVDRDHLLNSSQNGVGELDYRSVVLILRLDGSDESECSKRRWLSCRET